MAGQAVSGGSRWSLSEVREILGVGEKIITKKLEQLGIDKQSDLEWVHPRKAVMTVEQFTRIVDALTIDQKAELEAGMRRLDELRRLRKQLENENDE